MQAVGVTAGRLFSRDPSPEVLTGGGALVDAGTIGDKKVTSLMAPAAAAMSNADFPRKFVDLKTASTMCSF